jgi:hypothetical protein
MEKKKQYIRPESIPVFLYEELALCLTGSGTTEDYDETDYVWEG